MITNGNNYLGTNEKYCSEEFLQAYREADLVVTKGQANVAVKINNECRR